MIQKRLTIDKLGAGGMVIHSVTTGNAALRVGPAYSCTPSTPSYQQAPENCRFFKRQSVPNGRMVNAAVSWALAMETLFPVARERDLLTRPVIPI